MTVGIKLFHSNLIFSLFKYILKIVILIFMLIDIKETNQKKVVIVLQGIKVLCEKYMFYNGRNDSIIQKYEIKINF